MKKIAFFAAVIALGLAVTGCRSGAPKDAFLLTSDKSLVPVKEAAGKSGAIVSDVILPAYLKRMTLVRRVNGNRLASLPEYTWAEGLEVSAKMRLNENLEILLGDAKGASKIPVSVEFRQFELNDKGKLVVNARVYKKNDAYGEALRIAFELPVEDAEKANDAYSKALSMIAQEIAQWGLAQK